MIRIRILALALFLFAVSIATASAQEVATAQTVAQSAVQENVPRLVQFGSILKDSTGKPISGVASVTFAVYAEQDGGAPLWIETQNVLADVNGHYSALLGTSTAGGFPAEIFGTGESRWLGVTIARLPEMPRVLLASVPYALKAGDAQTLGGLPASSYVTTQQLASNSAAPDTTIIASGDTEAAAASASLALSASTDQVPQSITQAAVTGTGTPNYVPIWTSGSNLGVSKIYEAKGGFVGINTNTPLLQLDVNGNSIFRGSFQLAPQGTATASAGQPSHSFQWQSSVFNSSTKSAQNLAFGFRTVPDQNDVATPSAKLDLFYGPGGGVLADTGLSINNAGVVTFVPAQSFSGSQAMYISTTDTNGLSAVTQNANGTSIVGVGSGANSIGILAEGTLGGIEVNGGSDYAGLFEGDVIVHGNLSKSGGSFQIDHPLDPANKFLYHSFVESPDMMNIYNGNVVTDATGLAIVTMPDWFEALNMDFRYQLTAIGQHADAWIETEIAQNKFTIRTDKPNVKVSWMVTGVRQDAWANAHRIPVEQDKTAVQRGHYIHPELFGHSGDLSIGAMKPDGTPAMQGIAAGLKNSKSN
jgi:hypothetical protein